MVSLPSASMKPEDTFSSHLHINYPKILICESAVHYNQAFVTWLLPPIYRACSPLSPPYFTLNTHIAPSLRVNAILPLPSPVNNSEIGLVGKKRNAFFNSLLDPDAPLLLISIRYYASTSSTYLLSLFLSSTNPSIPEPKCPHLYPVYILMTAQHVVHYLPSSYHFQGFPHSAPLWITTLLCQAILEIWVTLHPLYTLHFSLTL